MKKTLISELFSKPVDLVAIANEVALNNIPVAANELNIEYGVDFVFSVEALDSDAYVGFTDDEKKNGLWNVRLFYNNMWDQAQVVSKQLDLDPVNVYRAIVAEIIVHEMMHVKQYMTMGKDWVNSHMNYYELEAQTYATTYGQAGKYRI